MKQTILITWWLGMIVSSAVAQNSETALEQIRTWYRDVNANLDQYQEVAYSHIPLYEAVSPDDYSREGQEIYRLSQISMTKYFDEDRPVKVVLAFEGNREDLLSEYYFKNGLLFFVDKTKTIYHHHKMDEDFQDSEKSVDRNRFYFSSNRMIRWIRWRDSETNPVSERDPAYPVQEKKILNDYRLYLSVK